MQIMQKFTTSGILSNLLFSLPKQYEDLFLEQCRNILCADTTKASDVLNPYALDLGMAATGPIPGRGAIWSNLSAFTIPSSYKLGSLDSDSKNLLEKVYRELYSQSIEVSTKTPAPTAFLWSRLNLKNQDRQGEHLRKQTKMSVPSLGFYLPHCYWRYNQRENYQAAVYDRH